MRIKTLLLLSIFLCLGLKSQSLAEIEKLTRDLKKPQKHAANSDLVFQLIEQYRFYNPGSCLKYAKKYDAYIKRHDPKNYGKLLMGYVYYYNDKNNIVKSKTFNNQSYHLNKKYNNISGLAINYIAYGRLFHLNADHANAVKNYLKAIDYAQKSGDLPTVNYAYRSLAFLFLDEGDVKKAYNYINRAISEATKSKNDNQLAFSYGVKAEIERTQNNLKNSEILFNKSAHLFTKLQNEYGLAWLKTNWSLLYLDQIPKSYQMQLEAQEIWDKIAPEHYMSIVNHYNIAYSYLDFYNQKLHATPFPEKQLLTEANRELKISRDIAKKNNNMQWVMFGYLGMADVAYAEKNIEKYKQNYDKYQQIHDSLYSQKRKNEIASIESQKVVDLKNKELQINRLLLKNKEKQKWYYIGAIVLVAVIGFLLWLQYRQSKKNNTKLKRLNLALDKANKNKMRFFGILNHDLRSPITSLVSFLHLQNDAPEFLEKTEKQRLEAQTTKSAEQLLRQMEDLLLWSKSQMENFQPHPSSFYVEELFEQLKQEIIWNKNTTVEFMSEKKLKIYTDKEYLRTILRNILSNANKILTDKADAKIICLAAEKPGHILIEVIDNGGGAELSKFRGLFYDDEAVGIRHGLGMHVIRELCQALNAKISVDSNKEMGETKISLKIEKI